MHDPTDYYSLTPDTVINAVESVGYLSDSRILALNSYENRVYQVGIEDQDPIIVKFYRPNRWTAEQIIEEHRFSEELCDLEIPVVAPLRFNDNSLLFYQGYRFAIYPRRGGHAPELDNNDHLEVIGRFIGRIHSVGKTQRFRQRPTLDIVAEARDSRDFLLQQHFIPQGLIAAYTTLADDLIKHIEQECSQVDYQNIRLHGDCHGGNMLWRDDKAHFVDFDDSHNGPAIHDLWMLLSGDYQQRCLQLSDVLAGYTEFNDFEASELHLVEALRTMRLMRYAAWLARRWQDPAFPHNFPWFNTERYWAEHILSLREQLAALNEPVLQWL